jgi:hypothetical protein
VPCRLLLHFHLGPATWFLPGRRPSAPTSGPPSSPQELFSLSYNRRDFARHRDSPNLPTPVPLPHSLTLSLSRSRYACACADEAASSLLSLAFYGLAQYPNSALWPPLRCTRIIMLARFYYKRGAGRGGQTSANLTAFAWGRAVKSSSAAARVVALREESASLCLCVTLCACLCVPAHGQVAPHRQCRLAPSNCEAALLFSQSAQNLLRADYRYYYQLTNAEGRINISAADRAVSQLLAALSALGSLSRPIAYFAQARLLSSYSFARSIPRGVLVMRKTRRPYNAIRLLSHPPSALHNTRHP